MSSWLKNKRADKGCYDVVVIGSGIGGLTAAALLAKAGKSVLLTERHDRPGGYAHGFKRKRYQFDAGVHLTSGCGSTGYAGGQLIHKVLQVLGVDQELEFIPVKNFSRVVFPQRQIDMSTGYDVFLSELTHHFPDQQQGLSELLSICLQLTEEVARADAIIANADAMIIKESLPLLFRYRRATLEDVYTQFLTDPELKAVFSTNWPYLGLPPSQVSFVYWATMLIGYLVDGAYYCRGGFQNFAETLVQGILNYRGEVLFNCAVRRINTDSGKVSSVELENGQIISTQQVISNADMQQTVQRLLGREYCSSAFLRRLDRARPSLSMFVVYLATDMTLSMDTLAHETFVYPNIDHDATFSRLQNGNVSFISISVPTLIDASLAPRGEHIVLLTTLLPYACGNGVWSELKPKIEQQMLNMAESYLPGLQQHTLFSISGSPATMQRYTLNHQGASYGWQLSPDQIGPYRISNKGPIEGLYFAGHWTRPGGGVYGVCVSGVQAAHAVLAKPDWDEFWGRLKQENSN